MPTDCGKDSQRWAPRYEFLALGIAFLTLAAVETAVGPDDDYCSCTAIAVRKLDDGTPMLAALLPQLSAFVVNTGLNGS
jgi:hypothetical protein